MKRFKKASDIRIGVIGYGGSFNIGRGHLLEARKAGMTPVAVAELAADRRAEAEKDFPGIATYVSTAEMLRKSKANLVAVITPHNTHAKLALQCLRAGRHVVCEKPFAITTAECDRMIAEARKRKLVVTTYHNRHWDGCIVEAVKHVRRKGEIGEVLRVTAHMGGYGKPRDWWRASKSISGGVLYDWGVHMLEYALQLIDDELDEVMGFAHRGYWEGQSVWGADTVEDEATAVVRFKRGTQLSLTISQVDQNKSRPWLEVTGNRGTYIMGWDGYELIRQVRGKTKLTKGPNMATRWDKYYGNLVDHLVDGEPLVITPEWARRPIHILDLADRSAKQGRALKAKYA